MGTPYIVVEPDNIQLVFNGHPHDVDEFTAIALRDALLERFPVERWEPVPPETRITCECDLCRDWPPEMKNDLKVIFHDGRMGIFPPGVHLPDDIALCRLVIPEQGEQ